MAGTAKKSFLVISRDRVYWFPNSKDESQSDVWCDWCGPYSEPNYDQWYEYWCYRPGWGWEFVFWTYG